MSEEYVWGHQKVGHLMPNGELFVRTITPESEARDAAAKSVVMDIGRVLGWDGVVELLRQGGMKIEIPAEAPSPNDGLYWGGLGFNVGTGQRAEMAISPISSPTHQE